MSAGGSAPGRREVAHRLFAAEFDDADFSYSESDEERAPNYVVTPTGARVNRLFVIGVLTETEPVNEEMLRARIVDPTGAFVTYAGQYQPEALAFLERTDPPAFLAVTGKARTFQPDDSDLVYTSIRPESISEVDSETRDRWVVQAAQRTIERVETMAAAIDSGLAGDALREALEADGVDPALAAGIPLALDHYGTTPDYLAAVRDLAEDALAMVAGDTDAVGSLDVAPNEGAGDASALADRELVAVAGGGETATESPSEETTAAEPSATEPEPETTTTSTESESATEPEPDADAGDESAAASTGAAEPDGEPETEPDTIDEPEAGNEPEETEADAESATADTTEDEVADEVEDVDDIGDFEPDEEFDPDDEVLTDEEREEAEELGGFSTGNEVEEPGEADIETPEPEPETTESESEATEEADADGDNEADGDDADDTDEPAGEVDVDDAVMDAMKELDDGDGAPHAAIVDAVVDRTGATPEAVDEAIQDALMSGRCYEPDDDVFKPI